MSGVLQRIGIVIGLAIGATGAYAPGDESKTAKPAVSLRVRLLEMEGLHWRSLLHKDLTFLDAKGTAMIWSADSATAGKLSGLTSSIRVIAFEETTGPVRKAKHVGWYETTSKGLEGVRPTMIETVSDYTDAKVTGQPDGEKGVLATVKIRDTWQLNFHNYVVRFSAKNGSVGNVGIQVPEVVTTELDGAWNVPRKGVLLIGLGVHSASDPTGQENLTLRERVIMIDADDLDESVFTTNRKTITPTLVSGTSPLPFPATIAIWVILVVLAVASVAVIGWSLRRGDAGE